jgi:hypothetical protein
MSANIVIILVKSAQGLPWMNVVVVLLDLYLRVLNNAWAAVLLDIMETTEIVNYVILIVSHVRTT